MNFPQSKLYSSHQIELMNTVGQGKEVIALCTEQSHQLQLCPAENQNEVLTMKNCHDKIQDTINK